MSIQLSFHVCNQKCYNIEIYRRLNEAYFPLRLLFHCFSFVNNGVCIWTDPFFDSILIKCWCRQHNNIGMQTKRSNELWNQTKRNGWNWHIKWVKMLGTLFSCRQHTSYKFFLLSDFGLSKWSARTHRRAWKKYMFICFGVYRSFGHYKPNRTFKMLKMNTTNFDWLIVVCLC